MAVDSTHETGSVQETGSVEDAKRRLREAAAGFDPYALVRSRPLSCTGGAFLLGLSWKWLQPGRAVSGLTVLSMQALGKVFAQNLAVRLKSGLAGERPADAASAAAAGNGQAGTAGKGTSVQSR